MHADIVQSAAQRIAPIDLIAGSNGILRQTHGPGNSKRARYAWMAGERFESFVLGNSSSVTRPDVVDVREQPGARSARRAIGFVTRTVRRFVDVDGTSHVRALAYESILIVCRAS